MATRPSASKRKEAKERSKSLKDLYFLIKWLDQEEDLYDVLPARDVKPHDDTDVLDLMPGERCQAFFLNKLYGGKVVANGRYVDMKKTQEEMEKDVDELDSMVCENHEESHDESRKESPRALGDDEIRKESQGKKRALGNNDIRKESQGKKRALGDDEIRKESQGKKRALGDDEIRKESQGKKRALGDDEIRKESQGKKRALGDDEIRKESQGKKRALGIRKESRGKKRALGDDEIRKESQGKKRALGDDESRKESQAKKRALGEEKEKGRNRAGGNKGSPRKNTRCEDKESRVEERPITVLESESGSETEDDLPVVSTPIKSAGLSKQYKKKSPRKKLLPTTTDFSDDDSPIPKSSQYSSPPVPSDPEEETSFEVRRKHNLAQNELLKSMIGLTPGIPPVSVIGEMAKLKEKLGVLEKSHVSLKRKVSEQALEIKFLKTSSAEISSASEVRDSSPSFASPQWRTPPLSKKNSEVIPNFLKGVDPVKLANAKLQSDPGTAALKLMDCVFTTEEMVNSNPSGVTKSKDPTRQKTIKRLDPTKMQYIDDFLRDKWGVNTTDKNIRKRMTQKCTDYFTNSRYTHLRAQS